MEPTNTSRPQLQAAVPSAPATTAETVDSSVMPFSSLPTPPAPPPPAPPTPLLDSEETTHNVQDLIAGGDSTNTGGDANCTHDEHDFSSSSPGMIGGSSCLHNQSLSNGSEIMINDDVDVSDDVVAKTLDDPWEYTGANLPQSQSGDNYKPREECTDDVSENDYDTDAAENSEASKHDDMNELNINNARGSFSPGSRRSHSTGDIMNDDVETGGEIGGENNIPVSSSTFLTSWSPLFNLQKKRYRKNSAESEGSSNVTNFGIGSGATSIMHKSLRPFRLSSTPLEEDDGILDDAKNRNNKNPNFGTTTIRSSPSTVICHRRYAVGEYVLISNHNIAVGNLNGGSNSASTLIHNANSNNLVNQHGFPEWDVGIYKTSEQRRGPYLYVLAKVVSVHFGEDAQYYTVRREDTMDLQRADAQYMEPMIHQIGIDAAKIAAKKKWFIFGDEECFDGMGSYGGDTRGTGGKSDDAWNRLRPCVDSMNVFGRRCRKRLGEVYRKVKGQTDSCLNGKQPYGISCQFTGVNLLVVCGIWYLVIDQVRLAFLPASMDYSCAVVSTIVWFVLILELIMEVFIRPSGYYALIRSEKAFLPSTVRYISTFHLISELISLLFFIPEFICVFTSNSCRDRYPISLANACLMSLYGPDRLHAFFGLSFITIMRLRIFGLVRHWTNMWINNTFITVRGENDEWRVVRGKGFLAPQNYKTRQRRGTTIVMDEPRTHRKPLIKRAGAALQQTEDYHVTNATKIGTALLITNAKRSLVFVFLIGLLNMFPVVFMPYGGTNQQLQNSAVLLQANNLALNDTSYETCNDLQNAVLSWGKTNLFHNNELYVLQLQIQPSRCEFQLMSDGSDSGILKATMCRNSTAIDKCTNIFEIDCRDFCREWAQRSNDERVAYLADVDSVRQSVLFNVTVGQLGTYSLRNGEVESAYFSVHILYNESVSVRLSAIYIFAIQVGMTLFVLLGLSVLRYDAGRLVLGPLRRILRIVAFYAKNPLSPPPQRDHGEGRPLSHDAKSDKRLGTFETEQLITAVTTTTDLLRKCWGVAGADIISSNLASEEGGLTTYFNPTVPGKAVYAVFAFVSIDKFQRHLHALKGDIMILINDIAAVLHEEVYRWGYEDSGQCNKNLGNAFLMVYRIGSVSEVMEKRERAEAVIFSTENTAKSIRRRHQLGSAAQQTPLSHHHQHHQQQHMKSHRSSLLQRKLSRSTVDNLDLSTLPGMRAFTDRALLGLLKTFAGIHREKKILDWNNDFRLGAGVGAMSITLNFGMDAGWAVEGAVGSAYKIDATYLSPHVNMASRMMSATKQYGVYILLSQSVHKLLSENAQDKLRHIDTVTVKGSSVQQKIFTYDAKPRSDFFLYSKTESQQDLESDRYSPAIWNVDQDLLAMRSHMSDEFMELFDRGRDEYLSGNWPLAVQLLKSADKLMFQRVMEEGFASQSFVENNNFQQSLVDVNNDDDERVSMGDGPSQRIIKYIADMGGVAPSNWKGYRPLTFK